MPDRLGHPDRGFTLLELVTVIAIIGMLVSLMIPAIQAARESSRTASCTNQIRQLMLGIHGHENRLGQYPGNGGDQEDSLVRSSGGAMVPIGTHDLQTGVMYRWGIGKPGARPERQPGSWAYAILPDIEQFAAYQVTQVESAGPLFLCPSRSRPEAAIPINDENGHYHSAGRAWAKTDYAGNASAIRNRPQTLTSRHITDGLTNTIGLGEKAFDPAVQTPTSWYWDEPVFTGGSRGTARSGLRILQDRVGIEYKNHWGAAHPSGVLFALFDGSVRVISRGSDWMAFRAALTPAGNEVKPL